MDESKGTVERVGGYRVVRRLATGGTSDVLLAKAEGPHGFERTVVLKLLLSQYRNDEEFAKMFAREAAAYARLSHSAIVQLFDFFQLDGQLVMVLEYVDGAPLSRLRGMLKSVGQNIDDKASLFIAQRIFAALAAAHESTGEGGQPTPVIHRDVNPSNVLVPWDGQVKLADFGIAKVTGVTHESAAGLIKGTFGYMAPEQVEGGTITPRADVYAAGIILWELLTRRRAFQRGALPEIEVLRAMAEPRITSIDILRPDVDKNVRAALTRALVPKADKRNMTAEEMVATLREVVGPDEGRERLAALLSTIRHEPKPVPTSLPPPNTDPMPNPLGATMPSSVPRPASTKPQPPRPLGPPRRTPSGQLPVVTTPKVPAKTAMGLAPPKQPEVKQPEAKEPEPPPEPLSSSAVIEQTEPVTMLGRDSEKMRLATPLGAIAPGLTLKDAIDEILTSVPSSIPPSVLSSRIPAPIKPAYPPSTPPPTAGPQTPRMIPIPAPPAAIMSVTMPLGMSLQQAVAPHGAAPPGATQPAPPVAPDPPMQAGRPLTVVSEPPQVSVPPAIGDAIAEALAQPSFDKTMREMERAEQPTVTPPILGPEAQPQATTSNIPAYDPPSQVPAPPIPSALPPAHFTPPPAAQAVPSPMHPAPMAPFVPPSSPSSPPIATTGSHDALLPQPKPSSVGVIAFMLVIVIAAGVAGTVLYVRRQQAKQSTPTTTPTTTMTVAAPFVPPASASALASASPSASASADPLTNASASAAPSASVAPIASASSAPVASASVPAPASAAPSTTAPPATDIPAGMGLMHTTGAAPNRRIYVDEKVVGQTPESVTVKCGTRQVKLGSAGKPQTIDIPCGAEITVSDR